MNLELADSDLAANSALDICLQLFEVPDAEVRYAQISDLACLLGFNERAPGGLATLLAALWGV